MAVRIGSARIDENGKAYGGKAGDQTGKEVSRQDWYLHTKGWIVYRPRTKAIADKLVAAMNAACDNANIGYDQWQRNTLYTLAEKVAFDVAKVKTPCETDCSALVRVCCAYAGVKGLTADTRTTNLGARLVATEKFDKLTADKYCKKAAYLRAGDVLCTKTQGHTVIVLTSGGQAAPWETVAPEPDVALGERTLREGCTGADVKLLQMLLMEAGYSLPISGADGSYGAETAAAVTALKLDAGLKGNGVYGQYAHDALMALVDDSVQDDKRPVKSVTVAPGSWRVRSGPGTDYSVLSYVAAGQQYEQVSTADNGWVQIGVCGGMGWLSPKAIA